MSDNSTNPGNQLANVHFSGKFKDKMFFVVFVFGYFKIFPINYCGQPNSLEYLE